MEKETPVVKTDNTQTENTQAEDIQPEETQAEHTQAEDPKPEETQAEDPKPEETQAVSDIQHENVQAENKPVENSQPESPEEVPGKKRSKSHRIVIGIVIALLVIAGGAAGCFFGFAQKYDEVFLKHSYINGKDVSGLTPEEADALIIKDQPGFSIDISFRDGKKETITGDQFDYEYSAYTGVYEGFASQNKYWWVYNIFGKGPSYEYEAEVRSSYDEQKLKEAIEGLPEFLPENVKEPEDAEIELKDNAFVIVKGDEGNKLDPEILADAVFEAVRSGETLIDADESEAYVEPKITADNEKLVKEADELNALVKANITIQLNDTTMVLDKEKMVSWLSVDKKGKYYKDEKIWEEKLREFVQQIDDNVYNEPVVWEFDSTNMGTITVNGGSYHHSIDIEAEYSLLSQELNEGVDVVRNPSYMNNGINHGLGNTYVEISIGEQHIWCYNNGECWLDANIVTGIPTEERYTPTGVYYVYFMRPGAVLRGQQYEDGSYEYESEVDWWMAFNGDIGMHDAPWRGAFGGSIYQSDGSHGCVNLPVWAAPDIYAWLELNSPGNVPVVVY